MLDLTRYWADHPPVHEMVAAYLGIKPKVVVASLPASPDDPSGLGGLIAQFPSGFVPADR